tara:strand:- start:2100 stop:3155 length:1056 start_codon:yes stop_codon:yes gene_type:complete
MEKINLLMTGAGAPGAPGIIKCIQKMNWINLTVGDMSKLSSGRLLNNKKFLKLLPAEDSNYVRNTIDLCKENNIKIIFPLVTKELFVLSQYKDKFLDAGIKVIVSDNSALEIANNKLKLYKHLQKNNIEVPKFYEVKSFEDIKEMSKKFNYPKNSFVLKYGPGNGSRAVRIFDEKCDLFDRFMNEKPNNLFTDLDNFKKVLGSNRLENFFIMEYLPGNEVTIDTVIKSGEIIIELIRNRTKINSGISVAGEFIEDFNLSKKVREIVSVLNLEGNIGFQFKLDSNNDYQLIEMNPRIQGTSIASMGMGINLPELALLSQLDRDYKIPDTSKKIGFIRYYEEVFYDLESDKEK